MTGSDIDGHLLERAREACYSHGSLKALPDTLLQSAFRQRNGTYCLVERLRNKAVSIQQDLRDRSTQETFHLLLLLALHKNNASDAYVLVLFDDYTAVKAEINGAPGSLKFK